VHLVPHSHGDTGWQITVDQYFFTEVYYVVDTVVDQLEKDPMRHFIYVETGFFARWWDEQPDDRRNVTKALVANGQLEFINGAWCMHDEAAPFYVEMVDQTTRGHQFLRKNFGETAIPRGTWQIDPFGHSHTQAWLLGAEAGFESLYWGRTDYQDLNYRMTYEGQMNNQWPEWVWQGSQSLGKSAEVFSGQLTTHNYGAPISWDTEGGAIQDNPSRHDYNLDEMVDEFIAAAIKLQNITRLNHQMWPCGSDFQYQNADHWFHNLDKIIHYVNYNASKGGPVVAFYSTPSHYTDAKAALSKKDQITWEVRSDDIFPLANDAHAYWSGYFTSRPGLKRQVRFASNFLNAARQMEVISGVTAKEVDTPTTRPSPPVGQSWTDSMEGAIAVATHHDGMSGTERQDVSNDYSQRISEGHFEVEAGVAKSLQKLAGITAEIGHCNCNAAGNCLNMSMCAYTTGPDAFTVLAWNPHARTSKSWLRIPVAGAAWTVTDLSTKAVVPNQATAVDERTKQLPLLYLNRFGMDAATVAAAESKLSNNATHIVTFEASLPPVGYSSFSFKKKATDSAVPPSLTVAEPTAQVVSNGVYEIRVNADAGNVESIRNIASGVESALNFTWGYYVSPLPRTPPSRKSAGFFARRLTRRYTASLNA
jgi:alpha-mannosidase